jgi:hypothetical protein
MKAYERKLEPEQFYEEILEAGKRRRRHQERQRRKRRWERAAWFDFFCC